LKRWLAVVGERRDAVELPRTVRELLAVKAVEEAWTESERQEHLLWFFPKAS
jgi:hypothetical protein